MSGGANSEHEYPTATAISVGMRVGKKRGCKVTIARALLEGSSSTLLHFYVGRVPQKIQQDFQTSILANVVDAFVWGGVTRHQK